ncbi:phage tail protein [Stappia sp. ES.058]|uniref:phage tail protein n=1 Tax=Stappia sp. ES.058 TaxID=1881061 RepID=UPI00087ACADC|nr:phage tail protein [Stappia sp. ES.058]SDU08407.1 Phage tail protein (Tail_P2_I) [Stappia sp. ES.058]
MTTTLVPSNSTPLERALDLTGAGVVAGLEPAADAIAGWKIVNPQPALAPWLTYEYSLGPLSPYVPNLYDLLDDGIRWERLRGTHAGMAMGLGFVGYSAEIVDPPARRLAWADYQLDLDRVRDDEADLVPIDGVARLSQPARSHFRRGVRGHDVPAAEASWTRASTCILGDDSGVHLPETSGLDGPKWSFGRGYPFAVTLSEAELTALGIWIPGDGSSGLRWVDIQTPWAEITQTWAELGSPGTRNAQMAQTLAGFGAYVGFWRSNGTLIGARRAKAISQVGVVPAASEVFRFNGESLAPAASGDRVYVEALTGFGDGAGEEAAEVGVLCGAHHADPTKPGALWIDAGDLVTPQAAIARTPVSIVLGRTVRERVTFLLDFE